MSKATRKTPKVDFSGIQSELEKLVQEYSAEAISVMQEVIPEVGKEAVKKLKQTSPRSKEKGSGDYAKGWTVTTDKGRVTVSTTIYGKKGTYNLAHLLEFGHAIKRGGREVGHAKAIEHIKPVSDWATNEVVERTIKRLKEL